MRANASAAGKPNQSGRFRIISGGAQNAKSNAVEAPVNNLIPESAVLNKVSRGCALVFGGSVSQVSAGRPAVCVSMTLLYHVSEKSRVQTELHASCSLYSRFAFEYGAKSVRPLF